MQLLWALLLPLAPAVLAQPSPDSESLTWGAYRPNLYFGLRPRVPQSLMTGLMWFGTRDYQSLPRARHGCDQGDGLNGYTWTEYDAREGGVQIIKDGPNNVIITTEFLKVPGGEHGGSWAARIKGEPMDHSLPSRVSTIFYAGLEGIGGIDMETEEADNGLEGPVAFTGSSPDLDDFVLRIVDGPNNEPVTLGTHSSDFTASIGKTHFVGIRVQPGTVWQAREFLLKNILDHTKDVLEPYKDIAAGLPDPSFTLHLSDEVYSGSNLYAVQKIFEGPFQFDVYFESSSAKHKLSSSILDEGIPALLTDFNERFDKTFPVPSTYHTANRDSLRAFSKAITSNLIGGIGYFYGTSIVNKGFAYEWDKEDDDPSNDIEEGARLTEPRALLTATPSRSFFPRGFYWDEGFHLLHIGEWDNDLSLEILRDWINLIDEDGWVAREQILGEEARSRVPSEFQTQIPTNANPPTLAMAVTAFIQRLKSSSAGLSEQELGMDLGTGAQITLAESLEPAPGSRYLESQELALDYLRSIYKPLKRHYDWFRRTQRGQIKQYGRRARSRTEAYRWRGRSQQHVLTSGMDDYPRGPPHSGELHLDLISWMAFFSRTMREISDFIGEVDDAAAFEEIEKATIGNIDDLHWSEENQMYCDVDVDQEDESYFVCHKGYLSIFPFMLELLPPESPHLGAILDLVRDPEHLWSPYGLRSLSISHPEFGKGENYWKGPIWIQMNFLALKALYKTYAAQEGPYQKQAQEIYSELRRNVIDNEYERTGYVWEQYDSITGEGRRSHPFTGWTSLVTLSTLRSSYLLSCLLTMSSSSLRKILIGALRADARNTPLKITRMIYH
ncbi:glycoside hydrolase family 63 protein [Laetiporus sulphureus 93-53]|uniref:Mannosyl-oligosaccharide glucosidase n=1 Tax=Laetiporus sulphureus 93-53 TaxID=1314785 RepID=A0A165HBM5_9APHY|nr:glycoside hydrolase family 63 protein [Laetiporus sulphureus 93-53]KZT11512.1 glycoside hydrolase family 63 protein [Laetiporus sulphureus 93-53]